MIESAKRHGLGAAQLLCLALIAAGFFGMYIEPHLKCVASDHEVHYKLQLGLVILGTLCFNPSRARRGLMAAADAWKAKSS